MPNPNERLLRLIVPVVLSIAGIGIAVAFFVNSKPRPPQTPPTGPTQAAPASPSQPAPGEAHPAGNVDAAGDQPDATRPDTAPTLPGAGQTREPTGGATPTQGETPGEDQAPAPAPMAGSTSGGLFVQPSGQDAATWRAIGAPFKRDEQGQEIPGLLDETSPYEFRLSFSAYGAGIERLLLTHHHTTWQATQSQAIQVTREWTQTTTQADGSMSTRRLAASPLAAQELLITEGGARRSVILWQSPDRQNIWRQTDFGADFAVFEAVVMEPGAATEGDGSANATPLVRLVRRYEIGADSHVVALTQTVENLTDRALEVQLREFGPTDLVPDSSGSQTSGYGGDKRRVRFGYLASPRSDPTQQFVVADTTLRRRASVKGAYDTALQQQQSPPALWPTDTSAQEQQTLVWAGMTNRYFGVAVHTLLDGASPGATPPQAKGLTSVERIDPLFAQVSPARGDDIMAMRLTLAPMALAPRASARTSLGVFAGPLSRPIIAREPRASAVNLDGMVVYNFGGWCGGCTFSWLTGPLIALLRVVHDYVTHDWALAIIVLVFIVRGVLHPVQVWSQIRTQRFAKQMQNLGPKQKKLQERYKEDKAKLQQETAKLWREEGITPASFVGCIPPFLQSPIWIALSAMIYFAVELRHEAAFFGVFQTLAPGWSFLADLSEPDKVVDFGTPFSIPVLSMIMGPIGSINILPFLLALVFYSHQKYFTPPTTATMTPEQQQAQMISKWMMVVMFPVMMYSAPAGFTLYFIANSTIAIFQTRWIKTYIERHDLDNPENARSKATARRKAVANSDSFLARMARRVEEAQKAQQGAQPGPGKAMQRRTDTRQDLPKRFKDR